MAIKAVVLDIGGVLEIIDDSIFPDPWPSRLGLSEEEFGSRLLPIAGEAAVGGLTESELNAEWQARLEVGDHQLAELREDCWRSYVGTLDQPLFDWFAAQLPRRKTGILSNSGPGAREQERLHGFEQITDDIVYSHEVGLMKPDPRVYALTAERLAVRPDEVLFLDDVDCVSRSVRVDECAHPGRCNARAAANTIVLRDASARPTFWLSRAGSSSR